MALAPSPIAVGATPRLTPLRDYLQTLNGGGGSAISAGAPRGGLVPLGQWLRSSRSPGFPPPSIAASRAPDALGPTPPAPIVSPSPIFQPPSPAPSVTPPIAPPNAPLPQPPPPPAPSASTDTGGPSVADQLAAPFAATKLAAGVGGLFSGPTTVPMDVPPEALQGALDVPTVREPSTADQTLGLVGGLAGLGSGAVTLAQGGDKAAGAIQVASGAAQTANALGAGIPYVGPALALAGIGQGLSQGTQAGEEAAVKGAVTAIPGVGPVMAAGFLAADLINLGLGEYKQGDLSKAIMNAKQTSLAQYGNQAQEEALKAAPNFLAALSALRRAPGGTSGQIQFGVGNEYAGETLVGAGGTTQTGGWDDTVRKIADPATLRDHPDLVANFIDKLWVQTGPSGAAAFSPGPTRDYQVQLLSKLPNTPEWLAAKQKILNSEPTDPRTRDPNAPTAPDLPVEPGFLRVGYAKIPTTHQYVLNDFSGRAGLVQRPMSPEVVATMIGPGGVHTPAPPASVLMDMTTGKNMFTPETATPVAFDEFGNRPPGATYDEYGDLVVKRPSAVDPAYVDMNATLSPYLKTLLKRLTAQTSATSGAPGDGGGGDGGGEDSGVGDSSGGSSARRGGYVAAKLDQPVPITVHGGEYVVPRGPLAEGLKALLGPGPLLPAHRRGGYRSGGYVAARHEESETIQGHDGLWYNVSGVVSPRVLDGPYLHRDVAESAARRRSEETDPTQLYAPLSPLGASAPDHGGSQ